MSPMTDQEIEEAVAHDMKLWEEHRKEMGYTDEEEEERISSALNTRFELCETRLDAKLERLRTDLSRWALALFGALTLAMALISRL